jgi:tRNA U34 5-methylaminomethyl-2-thiouridine-forming methyltransferase MnmC
MKQELVITEDGSSSIFLADLDEHYHSIHGALQESIHVFINAGLHEKLNKQDTISILEIGFGTGLNTLLTCLEANSAKQKIEYTAIEKFPLTENIYSQLNYCSLLQQENCAFYFDSIHKCSWNKYAALNDDFSLLKLHQDIQDVNVLNQFDIIYFDAFAPSAQPELWTSSVFKSMFNSLKVDGILVTYCAKGVVKRTLKEVGFKIESLPGPVGKREMTRARK